MSMKFNTALSVVGVILLSIAGSLCQLDVCGRTPFNVRIVGGNNATEGEWPWQVCIHVHGYLCGGTLINKDWVLSAAHCFNESSDVSDPDTVMYFGLLNQSGSNPHEIIRTARRIIRHSNYNDQPHNNDIALIQLSSSVLFSDYIKPVCLAAAGSVFDAGTESWVTGWGRLQSGGQLPDTLQEVMMPIVSNSDCDKAYGRLNITGNMICAGLLNQGGKDSCQGDSGGPMVSKKDSLWIQSGIVSFGIGCALPGYPGVFTRVSQYQDWIKSYMSSNTPGFVEFKSDVQQSTPTTNPTKTPTSNPTKTPTSNPTKTPTTNPTKTPTTNPTKTPNSNPTKTPTSNPTETPTSNPTETPTSNPTETPTSNPTETPTSNPTETPTSNPTETPTSNPTKTPTTNPTKTPTTNPTKTPILTSNSSFRSAPNLLLFSLSLMFSIIHFTFSLFVSF